MRAGPGTYYYCYNVVLTISKMLLLFGRSSGRTYRLRFLGVASPPPLVPPTVFMDTNSCGTFTTPFVYTSVIIDMLFLYGFICNRVFLLNSLARSYRVTLTCYCDVELLQ